MKNVPSSYRPDVSLNVPAGWNNIRLCHFILKEARNVVSIHFDLERLTEVRDAMTALIKSHPGAPRYKVQQDGDDLIVADHIDPDNPQVILKACTPVGREPAEWFETTFAPVHVPGPWAWED